MYEDMMAELRKMAAQVGALETESKKAAANLEAEVQQTLAEKEKHIVDFLREMCDLLSGTKCDRKVDIICYERGGKLPISVAFQPGVVTKVWFGWYQGGTSGILKLKDGRLVEYFRSFDTDVITAQELREELVTRWDESIEARVASGVMAKIKEQLARRTKAATDKLSAANERYNKFCGGDTNA